jgi:RNA polymerase sigma-70 factor, ECF subfamily
MDELPPRPDYDRHETAASLPVEAIGSLPTAHAVSAPEDFNEDAEKQTGEQPFIPPPHPDSKRIDSLVAAAITGDMLARDQLLDTVHSLAIRYTRGRLGRRETSIGSADDVAQEVCLAVIAALPTYEGRGLSFRAFIYGVASHKVTDAFRAVGRNRSEPMAEVPETLTAPDSIETPLLAAETLERLDRLLLATLTPRQREVLIRRIVLGLDAKDTAEALGTSPGSVRVIQHKALKRLREVLDIQEATDKTNTSTETKAEPAD